MKTLVLAAVAVIVMFGHAYAVPASPTIDHIRHMGVQLAQCAPYWACGGRPTQCTTRCNRTWNGGVECRQVCN